MQSSYRRVVDPEMIDVLSGTDDGLVDIEAFTARFARLVDVFVQQLPRLVDELEGEDKPAVVDRISRAEKRGWIANAYACLQAREVRNRIAQDHDAEGWRLIARQACPKSCSRSSGPWQCSIRRLPARRGKGRRCCRSGRVRRATVARHGTRRDRRPIDRRADGEMGHAQRPAAADRHLDARLRWFRKPNGSGISDATSGPVLLPSGKVTELALTIISNPSKPPRVRRTSWRVSSGARCPAGVRKFRGNRGR